jgi:tRNA G18 (ribose-2'-O)-methylase SpoU
VNNDEELKNNFNVHDHLKDKTVEELREINMERRLPYSVCAWNVDGNLNIGMMIRTACNLGAERFIVIGRKHYDKRSCVGSNHYFPIDVVKAYDCDTENYDVSLFWHLMNQYKYTPFLLETEGTSIVSRSYNIRNSIKKDINPCLVFGSESQGLPQELLEDKRCKRYTIPQLGVIRSYNVSAAASIAMWELVREMVNV